MRRSDSLPPFPPRFSPPGVTVPLCARLLAPVSAERCSPRARGLVNRFPLIRYSLAGTAGSPRFLGNPLCPCPALRPRWDLHARPLRRFGAAFRTSDNVGSHHKPLSGLHHTAWSLAVYASPPGLPQESTQDSLPTAGQALPGGIGYPLGLNTRFQRYLHLIPPVQAFPGARRVDPGGRPPRPPYRSGRA